MDPSYNASYPGDFSNTNQAPKTKKWLIVGIVSVVVLLVVVLLVSIFANGRQSTSSSSQISNAVNQYANYIINGDVDNSNIGEYSESKTYFIAEMLYSEDDDQNFAKFYREAERLLQSVDKKQDNIEGGSDNTEEDFLSEFVTLQDTALGILYIYHDLSKYDLNGFTQLYINGDFGLFKEETEERLGLLESSVESASYFIDNVKSMLLATNNMIEIFAQSGCLDSSDGNQANCANLTNRSNDELSILNSADSNIEYIVRTIMSTCLRSIYDIVIYGSQNIGENDA